MSLQVDVIPILIPTLWADRPRIRHVATRREGGYACCNATGLLRFRSFLIPDIYSLSLGVRSSTGSIDDDDDDDEGQWCASCDLSAFPPTNPPSTAFLAHLTHTHCPSAFLPPFHLLFLSPLISSLILIVIITIFVTVVTLHIYLYPHLSY